MAVDERTAFTKFARKIVHKLGYKLSRANPKTKLVAPQIPGWFSVIEAEALYMLVATGTARRILEVGHFLGRSTSAMCEGIRDSGTSPEFNSYDLGFKNSDEFVAYYKRMYVTTPIRVPPEYESLVYSRNKTTTEIAKAHLERFGLDKYVNLFSGDFIDLSRGTYDFIFCDATHDAEEIAAILPHVIAASNPGCVWAFHDMEGTNVSDVLRLAPCTLILVADSLGIFRYRGSGE